MIISHKYKFIFLKTRKTAGTSIEIALSKFLGENDVITPITLEDEKIREMLGYRSPQNFNIKFPKYTARDWVRLIIRRKKSRYYNHITATEIRNRIGNKFWSNYFKFCFERNPWDKAISLYYYNFNNKKPKTSLLEYLKNVKINYLSNWSIYTENDKDIVVDYIASYENLDQELKFFSKRLGLPNNLALPRAKGNFRKDHRNYREIMNIEEKELIADICSREIELFDFTF